MTLRHTGARKISKQSKDDLNALKALAMVVFARQEALLAHLEDAGLAAERKQLADFAVGAALIAYRNSVVNEYRYSDQRGVEGLTRGERTFSPLLDETYVSPRLMPENAAISLRDSERKLLKDLLDDQSLPHEIRRDVQSRATRGDHRRPRRGQKRPDSIPGIERWGGRMIG